VRILLCDMSVGVTGAGLMLLRYGEHLKRRGDEVSVFLPKDPDGPLSHAYAQRAFAILPMSNLSVAKDAIVLCNTSEAADWVTRFSEQLRTVWWFHEGRSVLGYLGQETFRKALRVAGALVFQTEHQRREIFGSLVYGIPDHRVRIVGNGIAELPGHLMSRQPEARPFRVVAVGNIYPRKRYGDLIHAVAALPEIEMRCLLVGRIWELAPEVLEIAGSQPERFKFFGEVTNDAALELMAGAHAYSLPSGDESMPITNLEAARLGKALVLSDLGVYRDIWRHGYNCLTHPVADIDMLRHALRILAVDPAARERLGKAAQLTSRRYTWDAFCANMDTVIASVT
jgi:glycosyltransferase involved in cell wall biosynthesis